MIICLFWGNELSLYHPLLLDYTHSTGERFWLDVPHSSFLSTHDSGGVAVCHVLVKKI